MKKTGKISTGKSGTSGHVGKSGSKVGSTVTTGPKLPSVSSTPSRSYASGSYITPKSNKSSSSFGIIWLPGRKRNHKHKETVYNSHRNEHPKERAPSMYNIFRIPSKLFNSIHFAYQKNKNFLVTLCFLLNKMQENNNFETIIQKWRRLSVVEQVEQKESVAFASMSGDSSNQQTLLKKKEDELDFSVSEKSQNATVAVAGAGIVSSSALPTDVVSANPEDNSDKQEFIQEDSKEAAGDTKDIGNVDKDNLEQKEKEKAPETKTEKGALEDNVDSVFLRSPPPHKTRSQASTVEEEDCGIKCLYYTLQCCDCVLM